MQTDRRSLLKGLAAAGLVTRAVRDRERGHVGADLVQHVADLDHAAVGQGLRSDNRDRRRGFGLDPADPRAGDDDFFDRHLVLGEGRLHGHGRGDRQLQARLRRAAGGLTTAAAHKRPPSG